MKRSGFSLILLCVIEVTAAMDPLTESPGDPERGRAVVLDRERGHCLLCHEIPQLGEGFQGNIGPPLTDVGARLAPAELRARIVDPTNLNPGTVNCPVVVNIDAYDSLSDEHKAALDSSVSEAIDHYLANYGTLLDQWDSVLDEKGVKKVQIDDAVIAEFRTKAADPIREQWIADMSAQGLPAQDLYDLVQSTLEQQRSGN